MNRIIPLVLIFLARPLPQLLDTFSKCSCPQQLKYSAVSYFNCICPPAVYFKGTKKQAMRFISPIFKHATLTGKRLSELYLVG